MAPQTPRHRDALSKKVAVTPRHRASLSGTQAAPRTPRNPRTPSTPNSLLPTIYNNARQLFARSACPPRLVGRETERKELKKFIQARVLSKEGGSLYVSGPPGTGKSALIQEVCKEFQDAKDMKFSYINCMSIKTTTDIYNKLFDDLEPAIEETGDNFKAVSRLFKRKANESAQYIVTLDEIDHLLTLDLKVLYNLFEYALHPQSSLILIGIANALDLTDRFLPRLKSRNLKPQLLPFLPYTGPQIANIITTRLKSLNDGISSNDFVPFIHPAAIQLCSRKVASQTGDLRKAFDICRRAIDAIESETKQKHQQDLNERLIMESPSKAPLCENPNLSSPLAMSSPACSLKVETHTTLAQSLAALIAANAPRATIAHVAKISSSIFNTGTNQRLQALNLQQKAVLCSLIALERKKRSIRADFMATPSKSAQAAPKTRELFGAYTSLCRLDRLLHPLTFTEFKDVVNSLETLSLISVLEGKAGSFGVVGTPSKRKGAFGIGAGDERQFGSCVSEKELESAVQGAGNGILKSMLSGEALE